MQSRKHLTHTTNVIQMLLIPLNMLLILSMLIPTTHCESNQEGKAKIWRVLQHERYQCSFRSRRSSLLSSTKPSKLSHETWYPLATLSLNPPKSPIWGSGKLGLLITLRAYRAWLHLAQLKANALLSVWSECDIPSRGIPASCFRRTCWNLLLGNFPWDLLCTTHGV